MTGSRGAGANLRQATRADIAGMHRVRLAVRENRLVSLVISEADYAEAIESSGRGWVALEGNEIVGFGGAVTVSATLIVCGLLVALASATVIVAE